MSIEGDATFWKQASEWLWVILAPVIGVAWGMLNRRIDETKATADAALSKADFDKHLEGAVSDRHNLRGDIKELFARGEQLKDHVNARVETLRTDMHESLGRLRDTMERGLGDMRKEMNDLVKVVSKRRSE